MQFDIMTSMHKLQVRITLKELSAILHAYTNQTTEPPEREEEESEEAVDSRGIPGWDRVDKLARALIKLRGLCVTNTQASEIKKLYHNLLAFDKRPLVFSRRALQAPRGRFARSKGQAIIGVDHMKKYIYTQPMKFVPLIIGFLTSIDASFQLGVQQPPPQRAE